MADGSHLTQLEEDLFAAVDEKWRTTPADLGAWANRAAQMKQLAEAADRVIVGYQRIEYGKSVRNFDEALAAYESAKEAASRGR